MDMKLSCWKITCFVVAIVAAVTSCPSASYAVDMVQEYSGAFSGDLVWQESVTMTADVLILKGATLTIRAGTQISVVPAEGTKIDPEYLSPLTELLVRGKLDIQGTPEKPVRFIIIETSETEEIAWAGITLDNAVESYIQRVELERADTAIRCVTSSPEIIEAKIANCRYGIVAQQQSHPKILGNILVDGEGGIFSLSGSNPYLKNNQIINHDEEAVFVDASSRPWLDRNTIKGNAIGLALYPRDLPYDLTAVTDNQENVRWLGRQGQADVK